MKFKTKKNTVDAWRYYGDNAEDAKRFIEEFCLSHTCWIRQGDLMVEPTSPQVVEKGDWVVNEDFLDQGFHVYSDEDFNALYEVLTDKSPAEGKEETI